MPVFFLKDIEGQLFGDLAITLELDATNAGVRFGDQFNKAAGIPLAVSSGAKNRSAAPSAAMR